MYIFNNLFPQISPFAR